jgi:hypothetical protein
MLFKQNIKLIRNNSDLVGLQLKENHTYLFQCGKVYDDFHLDVNVKCKFGKYGNGPNPILNGSKFLTGSWINDSGNLWKISATNVKWVFINGRCAELAKIETTIASLPSTTTMTVATSIPESLAGAKLTPMKYPYRFERIYNIISVSSGLITTSGEILATLNYPVIIYDHINLLLSEGQWYFDSVNNELWIYSTTDPNDINITYTDIDYGFEFRGGINGIEINNLEFSNYYKSAIKAYSNDNIKITNCNFHDIRVFAIFNYGNSSNWNICDNIFNDIETTAMGFYILSYSLISGNTGLNVGMGKNKPLLIDTEYINKSLGLFIADFVRMPDLTSNAFSKNDIPKGLQIINNEFLNAAYDTIHLHGSDHIITDNIIKDALIYFADGGSIHIFGYFRVYPNFEANNNIIKRNTITMVLSSANVKHAVYLDLNTTNSVVSENIFYKLANVSPVFDFSGMTNNIIADNVEHNVF